MDILRILNTVFIEPLKLIFEFIFTMSYAILTRSAGLSIVILSFVLNILLLPLYKKADEIQNAENEKQKQMKPDVDFIKRTFSGDEQFMMLQTYYRQKNYKPMSSLRSSTSLLLQIPFFMAAYSFLSGIELLKGISFGPISNLALPDGLLFGINVLPVLMTIINFVSTAVYTRGQPLKTKLQLYLMAVVFLFLLYGTPSALTLYYLLNNVFSLIKNIIEKTANKSRILSVLTLICCILVVVFMGPDVFKLKGRIIVYSMLLPLSAVSIYVLVKGSLPQLDLSRFELKKHSFFLSTFFLFVLTGFLIPTEVIKASPEEFINVTNVVHPMTYVINASFLSFGLFVVWLNVFYYLMDTNVKKLACFLAWAVCLIAVVDYAFFYNGLGIMSNMLVYDGQPVFHIRDYLINTAAVMGVMLLAFVIWKYKSKVIKSVLAAASLSMILVSVINTVSINSTLKDAIDRIGSYKSHDQILPFSKDRKNVVVFMLDRAVTYFLPYMFHERPELQKQFEGFIWYPNTVSFGAYTNVGTPGLFGGYEYTPEEMNRRDDILLVDKQNEALKVMPVLFDQNNYNVVVCDPPYAGYSWIPDLSIYDDYPNIRAYITEGRYNADDANKLETLNRNLLCFSLTKIMPNVFHNVIYNRGHYLSISNQPLNGFVNWFQVLTHLKSMTYFIEGKDSFIMIQNSSTHDPAILSEPEYVFDSTIDKDSYANVSLLKESIYGDKIELKGVYQISHYHANIGSMIQIGKWLDYLRENGAYDNTRIILVSDHGSNLRLDKSLLTEDMDLMHFNALLMVKDFGAKEFKNDSSFMTNADVVYLAVEDLIKNPVNPFTRKKIVKVEKKGKKFKIFGTTDWNTKENNGKTFKKGKWYSVHDNCLERKNWQEIDSPKKK